MRLQNSLSSDWQLTLVYRGYALPVIRHGGGLFVCAPGRNRRIPITLMTSCCRCTSLPKDLQRIRNYFAGTPPRYDMSWAEINNVR